jgi:hypothetical protein
VKLMMRPAFALLSLALLATVAWAIWEDSFPEWKRYQEELVDREMARLTRELEQVREDLDRPHVQAELGRLDAQLRALEADTTAEFAQLARTQMDLARLEDEIGEIRVELRKADRRLREPETILLHRAVTEELENVQRAYASATGTWPPDTLQLQGLWAVRDSLAELLIEIEGPIDSLRSRLEARRSEAHALRLTALTLTAVRDSLENLRTRLLEPATTRESALTRLRDHPRRVREIISPDGSEVARCPTCHGTLDDPPGVHPPLSALEVFRDVPCTVCHRGRGRALTRNHAHRGLLTAAGFGAGPHSLRDRIDRLASGSAEERESAHEELRYITGVDPAQEREENRTDADPDSAAAAAWAEWWRVAEAYFEPTLGTGNGGEEDGLLAIGIDPWIFSVRGRPLRYVGSRKCLSCHEVQHREHSRRWLATKFRSIERLVDVENPEPCFACHATGYDSVTGSYAEPGVTCEGCHGPGERYNEMMFVGQELLSAGEERRGRALLDHSSRLARDAISRRTVLGDAGAINVCVTCHHPRRHREGGPGFLEREGTGLTIGGEDGEARAVAVQ